MPRVPLLATDASPVAREVHRRMVAKRLSQKSLARAAGLNETYVRDLFHGRSRNQKTEHLRSLARALDCDLADLAEPGKIDGSEPKGECVKLAKELTLLHLYRKLSAESKDEVLLCIVSKLPGR